MPLERKFARTIPRENARALHCLGKAMFSSVKDIRDSTSFEQMSAIMLLMADEVIVKKHGGSEEEATVRNARVAVQLRICTFIRQYKIK